MTNLDVLSLMLSDVSNKINACACVSVTVLLCGKRLGLLLLYMHVHG